MVRAGTALVMLSASQGPFTDSPKRSSYRHLCGRFVNRPYTYCGLCAGACLWRLSCPRRTLSPERLPTGAVWPTATALTLRETVALFGNMQPFAGSAIGRPGKIETIPGAHCALLHKTSENEAVVTRKQRNLKMRLSRSLSNLPLSSRRVCGRIGKTRTGQSPGKRRTL